MLGPYDASSPAAETYLGWHFNPDPDKPGETVLFSGADKYRASYESPGLLEYVIRDANAADAHDDWKKHAPPPEPEASIDGVDPRARFVRSRALTLRVELPPPFPTTRVSAARWRMDAGPWHDLAAPWSASGPPTCPRSTGAAARTSSRCIWKPTTACGKSIGRPHSTTCRRPRASCSGVTG